MKRINVVTEGQTEDAFVTNALTPHFYNNEIFLTPRRVITSKRKDRTFRGGMTSYARAKGDINQWLAQDADAAVTTMFDYYALPEDFPGMNERGNFQSALEHVDFIETCLADDIGSDRFIPYLQLHEFEALLFSEIEAIDLVMSTTTNSRSAETQLRKIIKKYEPEGINGSRETAPSKRLLEIYPAYDKVLHGPLIANLVTINTISEKCGHFSAWLDKIEGLE